MPTPVPGRVSIILPSANEMFLARTVQDVLENARGDIEVIPVYDGYAPDPKVPVDPRVRGVAIPRQGMRPAINAGVAASTGQYLLKLDGHCMVAEGFDVILKAECADNWVVVPRRMSLDAPNWTILKNGKAPVDYHFLSWPFLEGRLGVGLHGQVWVERARQRANNPEYDLDDEMSSQGSCWFMTRAWWDRRIGPLQVFGYGDFVQEFQEIGLKTWLGSGEVKINKKTWYAHLHKGKEFGRGYYISKQKMSDGAKWCVDFWMFDRWTERDQNLSYLIQKFWPLPGWPEDWERLRWEAEFKG